MKESQKFGTVLAAGGIVVREASEPQIAIVQLRKDKAWVLPKGKLRSGEEAVEAAKREVTEETGHDVSLHEFLGALSHTTRGRHKVVQFWHMRAKGGPTHKLMNDVKAVRWLPLNRAIAALTHPHEKVFLASVGPVALRLEGSHRAPSSADSHTALPSQTRSVRARPANVARPSGKRGLGADAKNRLGKVQAWFRRVAGAPGPKR